jgi:hypothetical protein
VFFVGGEVMEDRHTIYLAGAMEKAGPYGAIWREEITPHLERLGYTVWNPYKEEINVGIGPEGLVTLKYTDFAQYKSYSEKIVDYDLQGLFSCAAVACRIDEATLQGAGTFGEITFCRWMKIPVFAWVDLPAGVYDVPSWALGCITEFSETKGGFYSMIPPESKFSPDGVLYSGQ